MRKAAMILSFVLLAGCGGGSDVKETKFMGTKPGTNYIQQGMQALAQKDINGAIKNFDMAIKSDPTNIKNYLVLGEVYLRLKNYSSAVDSFTAATKISPNSGDAYYLLATAEAFRREEGDIQKSVVHAQKSIQIFMSEKDQEKAKRSVALLKDITGQATPTVKN